MTALTTVATELAGGATPIAGLRGSLDINDNGHLGWPDALAWSFLATVGLLGVAVVTGMAFAGVTLAAHGLGRVGRATWDVLSRTGQDGRPRRPRRESALAPEERRTP